MNFILTSKISLFLPIKSPSLFRVRSPVTIFGSPPISLCNEANVCDNDPCPTRGVSGSE